MLSHFWQLVTVADEPLPEERFAFLMDGDRGKFPDMREHVGLGACNCCDYFYPLDGDTVLLVEETRLGSSKDSYKREFIRMWDGVDGKKALAGDNVAKCESSDTRAEKYASNCILRENRLKVYAGMLVLCRYAAQCREIATMVGNRRKRFIFLLVDSDTVDERNETNLDYWKRELRRDLRSVLSRRMIKDVEVIRPNDLAQKLPPGRDIPRP